MSFLGRLVQWYRSKRDEEEKLNRQFFLTLRSLYLELKPDNPSAKDDALLKRIDGLLNGPEQWAAAYEVEQMLVHFYAQPTLGIELKRRLIEAKRSLHTDILSDYEQDMEGADEPKQRAILARILNDLQWRYTVDETKRKYARIIGGKTGMVFLGSIVLFWVILSFFILDRRLENLDWAVLIAAFTGLWGGSFSVLLGLRKRLEESSFEDLKVMRRWNYVFSRAIVGLGAATILFYIMQSGLVSGAAFPVLNARAQETREELIQTKPKQIEIITKALEAVALFKAANLPGADSSDAALKTAVTAMVDTVEPLLWVHGVDLDGVLRRESEKIVASVYKSIVPENTEKRQEATQELLNSLRVVARNMPGLIDSTTLALLIVWSFLAGFSEKLIPNLLAKTEENIATRGQPQGASPPPPLLAERPPQQPQPPREEPKPEPGQ